MPWSTLCVSDRVQPAAGERPIDALTEVLIATGQCDSRAIERATRVADQTGFLYVDTTQGGRTGYLVEFGDTPQIFEDPREKPTQDYIRGEFS